MRSPAPLLAATAGLALALLAAPRSAHAQMSQVRGFVSDEQGNRLADVEVEMQYTGEGTKSVYHVKTNKKGGFVRVGLPPGPYKIFFTKEGYQKGGIDTYLSLGGLSDMCSNNPKPNEPCEDIKLKKAVVALSIGDPGAATKAGGAPGGAATAAPNAATDAATATAEEAAALGAAYAKAVDAIKASQWADAETALKEVLAKIPDQPVVHFNLGHVYRQKKDYASAEAEFRKVTELEPTKPEAFVAMAALYEAQGKGQEAVAFLQGSAGAFEQNAKYQTALGATAMNQGMEKDAEAAFEKAVALDPSNVELQYFLATLALNRNEVPNAIAHLEKYIAEAPAGSPTVEVAKQLLAALKTKK
jgi:cytochrome c-type biogenesis protein CcmH/NrfG